jgi:hypothetical protein
MGDEKSLPTIDQATSTGTTVSLPTVTATPQTYIKTGISTIAGVAGFCYLAYGKKTNDVQKMIIGAVLTLLSFFIF